MNDQLQKVNDSKGISLRMCFLSKENITSDDLDKFLNELKLEKEDLEDYVENTEGITNYSCDVCEEPCVGDFRQYHIKEKSWTRYNDVCKECTEQNKYDGTDEYRIYKCPKYNQTLSYNYEIISLKQINETDYLYVVEEQNLYSSHQDIHYYLKYYKNGKIILDHELNTYNPYFGCIVKSLQLVDDTIKIIYNEKHCECEVWLIIDENNKSHNIYLKSKPSAYARSQNEDVEYHEIGKIVKFIKDGRTMEKLSYWN